MIRPGIWRRELAVPLQSIQAELNRLFEEYWQPPGPAGAASHPVSATEPRPGRAASTVAGPDDAEAAAWMPAIDLWEAAGQLILAVDLPGVDPGSADLALTGNVLTIRGTRAVAPGVGDVESARGRVRERPAGSFYRQITLVDDVDFDRIEAQAKDGVLTVRLPKRGSAQARTIPIRPARD